MPFIKLNQKLKDAFNVSNTNIDKTTSRGDNGESSNTTNGVVGRGQRTREDIGERIKDDFRERNVEQSSSSVSDDSPSLDRPTKNNEVQENGESSRQNAIRANGGTRSSSDSNKGTRTRKRGQAETVGVTSDEFPFINSDSPKFQLFPEQKGDVDKALKRFENGRGILFTNGTGTGKTAVGAGIILEFVKKNPKSKILVVTPSDTKNRDWIEEIEMFSNIKFKMLKGIKDKGEQFSVTTYSNFSQNRAIVQNDYDLIVYDESHKLLASNTGTHSTITNAHFVNANHTNGRFAKHVIRKVDNNPKYISLREELASIVGDKAPYHSLLKPINEWEKVNDRENLIRAIRKIEGREPISKEEYNDGLKKQELQDYADKNFNGSEKDARIYLTYAHDFSDYTVPQILRARELYTEMADIETEARAGFDKKTASFHDTKVVFLSATPYKGHFSLEYTDEFVTDVGLGKEKTDMAYNAGTPRDNFYMNNFGYDMKYNKLTQPDVDVDVTSLEVMFTEEIIKSGAMSGRTLKVEADYSRKFVEVDGGYELQRYKDAMEAVSDYSSFSKFFRYRVLGYPQGEQVNESLMCGWYMDRIKKHIAKGRKIVIFHKYQSGSTSNNLLDFTNAKRKWFDRVNKKMKTYSINDDDMALQEYHAWYNKYGLVVDASKSVIEQIKEEFGSKAVYFNGGISKKKRKENIDNFNKDPKIKIIVVQEQAGREGISLHDRESNGNSIQRVVINFSKPTDPISAIQVEGRIYRLGVATNAIIEYPILGTQLEKWDFVNKINRRVGTVENLAMGEKARGLSRAFKDGYLNPHSEDPSDNDGVGGKEDDYLLEDELTPFEKAKALYSTTTPKGRAKNGSDFFGTPDPIGYKMVEFARTKRGESMLEPSAGTGSIGRYFPLGRKHSYIEMDEKNRDRLLGVVNDSNDILDARTFESVDTSMKFDAVVMNPPYGKASKMAFEHTAKALEHLRDGGRVVTLVPSGSSMVKRLKAIEDDNRYAIRMRIDLPQVTFKRVGTTVMTSIYIIDKIPKYREYSGYMRKIDFTDNDKINELFDAIEHVDAPSRLEPLSEKEIEDYLAEREEEQAKYKAQNEELERILINDYNVSKSDAQTLRRLARGTSSVEFKFSKLEKISGIGDVIRILETL